ncbi:MAG TPA: nucleotidyltransferase domain-containing protein [Kofleriaceae bacterium]|nr:nucleotidyltransferase domain-containing protein [Kofleriaceae bacterium]
MTAQVTELPQPLEELVDALAAMPGAVAVVLGGSRAAGGNDAASDWDLGVYYRGSIDTGALAERGTVHPPGSWGRIMHGGAWLVCAGMKVDVLLRDLDVVEHWSAQAVEGRYEVDGLLGYLAGIPTYSLLAERAVARVLRGALAPAAPFPARLAELAPPRWRFHAQLSLAHARMRAARQDAAGTLGHAARAALEHAHALLCERRTWTLNEKQLLERAGLVEVQALFAGGPGPALGAWLDALELALPPR